MYNVTKIQASTLPGIYPTSYTDRLFTYARVKRTGLHQEEFETSERWKTIYSNQLRMRAIQAILYDKYTLEIQAHENQNIDLFKHVQTLSVTTKEGITHHAEVLEVERSEESDTNLSKVTMTYYDSNPNNYRNQQEPVVNFLTYDSLSDRYEDDQLVRLFIINPYIVDSEWTALGGNYSFYSALIPKYEVTEAEKEEETQEGLKIDTRVTVFRYLRALFFLSATETNIFKKYVATYSSATLTTPDGNFGAVEPIEFEVEKVDGAGDLFKVTAKIKYETDLDYYPLNT